MVRDVHVWFKKVLRWSVLLLMVLFVSTLGYATVKVFAAETDAPSKAQSTEEVKQIDPKVTAWAFLAAAISTGLGSVAAGIAVGYVGAAALGTIGERPELAGRALIFVGLAEGIAIYGLIVAIMILGKV